MAFGLLKPFVFGMLFKQFLKFHRDRFRKNKGFLVFKEYFGKMLLGKCVAPALTKSEVDAIWSRLCENVAFLTDQDVLIKPLINNNIVQCSP